MTDLRSKMPTEGEMRQFYITLPRFDVDEGISAIKKFVENLIQKLEADPDVVVLTEEEKEHIKGEVRWIEH